MSNREGTAGNYSSEGDQSRRRSTSGSQQRSWYRRMLRDRGIIGPHREKRIEELQKDIDDKKKKIEEIIINHYENPNEVRRGVNEEQMPYSKGKAWKGAIFRRGQKMLRKIPELRGGKNEEIEEIIDHSGIYDVRIDPRDVIQEMQIWTANIDTRVEEIKKSRAMKDYRRFPITSQQRSEREASKDTRTDGENELRAIAQQADTNLKRVVKAVNDLEEAANHPKDHGDLVDRVQDRLDKMIKSNEILSPFGIRSGESSLDQRDVSDPIEVVHLSRKDAVRRCAEILTRGGNKAVIVDLDYTIVDTEDPKKFMTIPPDFIKAAEKLMKCGIPVIFITGRGTDVVVQNLQNGGASQELIDKLHLCCENGITYRGPLSKGKEVIMHENVKKYASRTKRLLSTIEEHMKKDSELKEFYAATKDADNPLIGQNNKTLGATVHGKRFTRPLQEYLSGKSYSTEKIKKEMSEINKRIYEIINSILRSKDEYNVFTVKNTGELGIELYLDKDRTGVNITKALPTHKLIRDLGLTGIVAFGDDDPDLAVHEALQRQRTKPFQTFGQIFVGVEKRENASKKTPDKIREVSSYMTDGPDDTVKFIEEMTDEVEKVRSGR